MIIYSTWVGRLVGRLVGRYLHISWMCITVVHAWYTFMTVICNVSRGVHL